MAKGLDFMKTAVNSATMAAKKSGIPSIEQYINSNKLGEASDLAKKVTSGGSISNILKAEDVANKITGKLQ